MGTCFNFSSSFTLSTLRNRKIARWKWRGQGKTETGVQVANFGFNGISIMAKVGSLYKVKSLFYFHVFGILLKQLRKLETFLCLGWIFVIYCVLQAMQFSFMDSRKVYYCNSINSPFKTLNPQELLFQANIIFYSN